MISCKLHDIIIEDYAWIEASSLCILEDAGESDEMYQILGEQGQSLFMDHLDQLGR